MADTLAQKIRAKYPGTYDDLSDADLEAKVRAKFPGVYDDLPRSEASKPSAELDLKPGSEEFERLKSQGELSGTAESGKVLAGQVPLMVAMALAPELLGSTRLARGVAGFARGATKAWLDRSAIGRAISGGLEGAAEATGASPGWSAAQQRAAMAMSGAQDRALAMNAARDAASASAPAMGASGRAAASYVGQAIPEAAPVSNVLRMPVPATAVARGVAGMAPRAAAPAVTATVPAEAGELGGLLKASVQAARAESPSAKLAVALRELNNRPSADAQRAVAQHAVETIQEWRAAGLKPERMVQLLQGRDFGQTAANARKLIEMVP